MLDFMRKRVKTWALRFLLFIVAATFALWGVGGYISQDTNVVLSVDGEKIYYPEYRDTYSRLVETYRSLMGDKLDAKAITDLKIKESAVDYLLERALLLQEAEHLDMTTNQAQVRTLLQAEPAFQDKGAFSPPRYQAYLDGNGLTADQFEAGLAVDLTLGKVRSLLRSSAVVTPGELEDELAAASRKVGIDLLRLDADLFIRRVPPPEEKEISAYFSERREDFRRPETFTASFAVLDPAVFRGKVSVTEDELAALYQERQPDLVEPARTRMSHILFALPSGASAASISAVRVKAESVLAEIRAGKLSFAAAAKKHSQDPSTAGKGGDLGTMSERELEPAIAAAVSSLEAGKISEPIPTAAGFELVLMQEKKPSRTPSFAEVKDRLREEAGKTRAVEAAREAADAVVNAALKGKSTLESAVRTLGLAAITPPPFTRKTPPRSLDLPPELLKELFLAENNEAGGPYELAGKLYVFQMLKRVDSYLPDLAEAKEEVLAALLVQKALEVAEREGEKLGQEVSAGTPLRTVASRIKAQVRDLPPFSILEDSLKDIAGDDARPIIRASFTLKKPGAAALVKGRQAAYLIALRETATAEVKDPDSRRQEAGRILKAQLSDEVLKGFVASRKEEKKDRIKIHMDRL